MPDKEGRREILQIHFEGLRRRGRLSEPLCRAIDGYKAHAEEEKDSFGRIPFTSRIKSALHPPGRLRDLAADKITGGFSGADCSGLVRCAGSIALSRAREQGMGIDGLTITLDDVTQALEEVKR